MVAQCIPSKNVSHRGCLKNICSACAVENSFISKHDKRTAESRKTHFLTYVRVGSRYRERNSLPCNDAYFINSGDFRRVIVAIFYQNLHIPNRGINGCTSPIGNNLKSNIIFTTHLRAAPSELPCSFVKGNDIVWSRFDTVGKFINRHRIIGILQRRNQAKSQTIAIRIICIERMNKLFIYTTFIYRRLQKTRCAVETSIIGVQKRISRLNIKRNSI